MSYLWHGRASVVRPAKACLQQLWTDPGCRVEYLAGAMDDRDEWRGESGQSVIAADLNNDDGDVY